jgi:hypothetical protein
MKKKTISVASRKAKARWIQDKVTTTLREIYRVDKGKTPQEDGCHIISRQMGGSGVDIIFSPIIRKINKWAIECKNGSSIPILSSWRQTLTNAKKINGQPIMFIKYPEFQQPLVVLKYDDYFREYGAIIDFAFSIIDRYEELNKNPMINSNRLSELLNTIKQLNEFLPMRELRQLKEEYHGKL